MNNKLKDLDIINPRILLLMLYYKYKEIGAK